MPILLQQYYFFFGKFQQYYWINAKVQRKFTKKERKEILVGQRTRDKRQQREIKTKKVTLMINLTNKKQVFCIASFHVHYKSKKCKNTKQNTENQKKKKRRKKRKDSSLQIANWLLQKDKKEKKQRVQKTAVARSSKHSHSTHHTTPLLSILPCLLASPYPINILTVETHRKEKNTQKITTIQRAGVQH